MTVKTSLLAIIVLLFSISSFAQTFIVSGRITDETDGSALIGVGVTLSPVNDTTKKVGNVTDENGNFRIENVTPGKYTFTASYIGFKKLERSTNVVGQDVSLGTIKMQVLSTQLKNVTIEDKQIRVQQLGDTSQFNANAYKTNPDANAEDLVNKMPGISSDATGVKVNGEDVKQVYVDGKPFFGDDPTATLKNFPAEVIDKIQVFDKLSDQAQFSGFDDGSSSKTINIITKKGKNNGQFGKVYAGYGTDDRYTAGGNINFFNGDQRISLIGMSNNINQQNFSTEDILGVTGNSGGQNRGGGQRGGGGGGRGGNSGGAGGGSNAGSFLVGQQGGITATNSIGLNYSDNWGKKIKVSGSYFFNATDNTNSTQLTRNYFTTSDSALLYNENSTTESKNYNHRANLRLEYNIDSSNSIILTPRFSYQTNNTTSTLSAFETLSSSSNAFATDTPSTTGNYDTAKNHGYTFSNDLLYRHKFRKQGRTISFDLGTQLNDKEGTGGLHSINQYADDTTNLNQKYTQTTNGYTFSGNLTYTEPISKKSQLMLSYNPSYNKNMADKETNTPDPVTGDYTLHTDSLSNKFDNTYITHKGSLSYRLHTQKLNFSAGITGQYATLEGQETYPYAFAIDRQFTNVLPNAMFNYRFSKEKSLRIFYRTSTNPPSISQLQNVVDVSNPLLLKTGNPDLKQDYTHTLIFRYGGTNSKTARSFFAFLYGSYVNNYIGNATYLPATNTRIDSVYVPAGSQLTKPVNLNGYYTAKTFFTLGLPAEFIKSNINLNAGLTYAHTPAQINDQLNFSNNYAVNGGVVIGSNISEKIDFTLSYNANYNLVKNTLQTQSDNTYYSHIAAFKINWMPYKGLVINTDITNNYYSGLTSSAYNQSFFLWNAYVGYKFLKNRALEARISAFDILNQNKAIARTTTETYIEDSRTQVLTQYFMFTLTYTLRNFKAMAVGSSNGGDSPDGEHHHHNRQGGDFGGPPQGGPNGG